VERPGSQVIKVNLANDGTDLHCVPPDDALRRTHHLPNMHNLNLMMRKPPANAIFWKLYRITASTLQKCQGHER